MLILDGYSSLKIIYEGKNTIIYRGTKLSDNKSVILKTVYFDQNTQDNIPQLIHEYNIIKYITNNNEKKDSKIEQFIDLIYQQDIPILVLEDAGEANLREYLNSPLSLDLFFRFALQLVEGLHEIHSKTIIHKDIKPDNIVINTFQQTLKIIDFCLATRFSQNMMDNELQYDYLKGSLAYMSPEQTGRLNRTVDYRSDYYSLGVTFYEMLTGNLPFKKKEPIEIIYSHLAEIPVPPHLINPQVPTPLSEIISRLMAKTPENRYMSSIGILSDLQKCYDEWKKKGNIKPFILGQKDVSDKLQISEKLYGRDAEIQKLLNTYEEINTLNQSGIIFLSGPPGVGKTSLIKELYKPIAQRKGYFTEGKFDQYQRTIPYSAFSEALDTLIHRLLKESSDSIEDLKNSLLNALGGNAQLIIELLPSLEILIGPQPSIPDVNPHAMENRFMYTIRNFIRTLSQPSHPLVIFIDDWQWADSGSLKLLISLMVDSDIKNLLIIASYRDDKLSSSHPFQLTLNSLLEQQIYVKNIQLPPINEKNIEELLGDTLNCPPKNTESLAKTLFSKTQGNPFFIKIFLNTLNENKMLYFSQKSNTWEWNIKQINHQSYTDNVINLLIDLLFKLPKETLEVLKTAACIGHLFEVRLLSNILNKPLRKVLDHLLIGIKNNFILPLNNNYEYIDELADTNQKQNNELFTNFIKEHKINYRFAHDRIQQACYSLLDQQSLERIHLSIGRHLRDHPPTGDILRHQAETVNHLNLGIDLVDDDNERLQIAELNLIVGRRAKKANAYELSLNHFLTGIGHLNTDSWTNNYQLIFNLYQEFANSQFLCGEFKQSEQIFNLLLSKAKTDLEKANIYLSMGRLFVGMPNYTKAIYSVSQALNYLDKKLPEKPSKLTLFIELVPIKISLFNKSMDQLYNQPEISPEKGKLLQIYNILGLPAILTDPYIFMIIVLRSLKIILKNGNSPYAITSYLAYATAILRNRIDCSIRIEKKALKYIDLSLKLLEKYNIKSCRAEYYQFYGLAFHARRNPIRSCFKYFEEAYILSKEEGNLIYAAHNLHHMESSLFLGGEPIPKLLDNMETILKGVNVSYGREELACLLIVKQFHASLISEQDIQEWSFENFKGRELAHYPLDGTLYKAPAHYCHRRSFFCYLMEQYEEALWHYKRLTYAKKMNHPAITFLWINYYFIYPLTLIALYNKAPFFTRLIYLKKIKYFLNILKIRTQTNPENHLNKYYLVLAELARLKKDPITALKYYSESIKAAKQYGFLQEEAIAYELTAKFFVEINVHESASNYFVHAYRKFETWGAKAKTTQMMKNYGEYLKRNLFSHPTHTTQLKDTETITDSSVITDFRLNISSIMKASQAISSEIEIRKLLDKLLSVLLENAGAQRVILLAFQRNQWVVEAEGTLSKKEIYDNFPPPIDTRDDIPLSLISYLQYTKNYLIINDASSGQYADMTDPYLNKGGVKSVLLLPVLYQGRLNHIFYLENNVITGAFNAERLQIVQLLASQAAISIENATLYKQATRDPLTGLGNRNLLYNIFPRSLSRAKRNNTMLGIIFIDLDFFKTINDSLGHEIGDELLVFVAKTLQECVRETDLVVRLGGDEFVLLLEGLENKQQIKEIVDRFFKIIANPVNIKGHFIHVSTSMGISLYPHNGDNIKDLLNKADISLYQVKESGKNSYDFYEGEQSINPPSP